MHGKKKSVVVVGAGVAGLCAAIDLACRGYGVRVLERANVVGGKLRELVVGEKCIASGPTVLTMRWVFDELFKSAGVRFDDFVTLEALEPIARHFWDDGSQLDLYTDADRSYAQIEQFAGKREADAYLRFRDYTQAIYAEVEEPFLRAQRPTYATVLKLRGFRALASLKNIDVHRSMWSAVENYFSDMRLRQLFSRYATYCGSSPFLIPATFNLVTHVENQSVYRVRGGIVRLVEGLERLAQMLGVEIQTGCHVERIIADRGRAQGVMLSNGQTVYADAVVFNGDVAALSDSALGQDVAGAVAPSKAARSLSAVTWSALVPVNETKLAHHNVFFSRNDYQQEFDAIFRDAVIAHIPTVYICAQDRMNTGQIEDATQTTERVLILINAPAVGERFHEDERSLWMRVTNLCSACGYELKLDAVPAVVTTPKTFSELFPASEGALYGDAYHQWNAAFLRNGARSKIAGLYLAGGTVHPGPGVPMCAMSGTLASQCVHEDLMGS